MGGERVGEFQISQKDFNRFLCAKLYPSIFHSPMLRMIHSFSVGLYCCTKTIKYKSDKVGSNNVK